MLVNLAKSQDIEATGYNVEYTCFELVAFFTEEERKLGYNNRSDARVFADWFMFNGTAKLVCGLFAKRSQASACDGSAC